MFEYHQFLPSQSSTLLLLILVNQSELITITSCSVWSRSPPHVTQIGGEVKDGQKRRSPAIWRVVSTRMPWRRSVNGHKHTFRLFATRQRPYISQPLSQNSFPACVTVNTKQVQFSTVFRNVFTHKNQQNLLNYHFMQVLCALPTKFPLFCQFCL